MNANVKFDSVSVEVDEETTVSGQVCTPEWWPSGHRVGVVLAHDVETSFEDPEVVALQRGLAERGHLTLAFNFPYAEAGKKKPDPAPKLDRAYRAACARLMRDAENAPARMIAGGYGLGARVACQMVAQGTRVEGVVCLGFPLHPSNKPHLMKADPLYRIICPLLFVQGSRDPYCRVDRLTTLLRTIGAPANLYVVEDCVRGLTPAPGAEREPEEVRAEVLRATDAFIRKVI